MSSSYWDLLKGLYFADTTERGDRGWKEEAQRQGEDRVTLRITLICKLKYLSYSLDEVPPQFKFFFVAMSQFDWPITQKKKKKLKRRSFHSMMQLQIGCILFLKIGCNYFWPGPIIAFPKNTLPIK